MEDLRHVTSNCFKNQIKHSEELSRMTHDYPTTQDIIGAIKGVVALYYAYKFNVIKAVEGKLNYITHQGENKNFQAYEKLSIVDLEQFAQTCFDKGDYALSIEFVRNILTLLPKLKESDNKFSKDWNEMSKRVNLMKENLIKLNNGYLEKHQTFIHKNYIVLPYLVDKKLRRKKKQPKFINTNFLNTKFDVECENRYEWMYMETCQMGKVAIYGKLGMIGQIQTVYLCRYLHHNNPYLKLGPFKEEMYSHIPYSVVFHDILSNTEISTFIL